MAMGILTVTAVKDTKRLENPTISVPESTNKKSLTILQASKSSEAAMLEYSELSTFLGYSILQSTSFHEIKKQVEREIQDKVIFLNHFRQSLNQEILYRKEKGKDPSVYIPENIKQIDKEIMALDKIIHILKIENITLLRDGINDYNKTWTPEVNEKWKEPLIAERASAGYTYIDLMKWIDSKNGKSSNKTIEQDKSYNIYKRSPKIYT